MNSSARYVQARDGGCQFLLSRLRSDGGFGSADRGVADYYKPPLAFVVCGASAAAARLFDWIRRQGITSDGDFGPRPEEARSYYYTYYNAWIIQAAQRQGQFDIAQRGLEFLLGTRNAKSGGFYSSPSEGTSTTNEDLWIVCGAGLAALYCGRVGVAQGVGEWLRRLRELQPEFPRRLLTVWNQAEGLVTSFIEQERARYELVPGDARTQYFFQPGIAAGFLAQLFKATGDKRWLDLAIDYMRAAEIGCDYLYDTYQAGKVGWAAAVLATLTGQERFRKIAARVGDMLVCRQHESGCWEPGASYCDDYTAEMVVWLDEIHQALSNA